MPFILGTKKVVPLPIKKQKKVEAKAKDAKKEALYKRRKESEALLFGSELFEPISKKEKEVVIHFPENHTDEGIFISKCGKFGYSHAKSGFFFNLFYFIDPILEWEASLSIIPSETIWLFDNLSPEELEDLAIKLKRAEYTEEKEKLLKELKNLEKQRKEELDKADEEFEAAQEEEFEQQKQLFDKELEILIDNLSPNELELENKEKESTLKEVSAIEAKLESEHKLDKPKMTLIPLQFGKVNK